MTFCKSEEYWARKINNIREAITGTKEAWLQLGLFDPKVIHTLRPRISVPAA